MAVAAVLLELYRAELPLSASSAFVTHGASTACVLLTGWILCCATIEFVAANVPAVRASKLQSDEKARGDTRLRTLAVHYVVRQWVTIFAQAILFAPLLKAAFPLHQVQPTAIMTARQYGSFFAIWLVSNDFLFTVFHRLFHEVPWLYRVAHKEHHTWRAPFAWMSHAMSAWEAAANGIALMAYPTVHALWLRRATPLELVWACQLIGQLIGCIEHSGYDALHPLLLVNPKRFPVWLFSTTKHHDDHHRLTRGNYGGYCTSPCGTR